MLRPIRVRKRLEPGEEAFGVRMGHLFEVAKSHRGILLSEVNRLLDHPAYEPRMAAMCILDFKARNRLDEGERLQLCRTFLDRHDRITTWDMVDRAAPRVVGGYMTGRPPVPLHELAAASEPLRRRTAVTAPLYFVRAGSDYDLATGIRHCRVARRRSRTGGPQRGRHLPQTRWHPGPRAAVRLPYRSRPCDAASRPSSRGRQAGPRGSFLLSGVVTVDASDRSLLWPSFVDRRAADPGSIRDSPALRGPACLVELFEGVEEEVEGEFELVLLVAGSAGS